MVRLFDHGSSGGVNRNDLVKFLESKKIQTRMLFAGNILRHPCFDEMRKTGEGFRVIGELTNTDSIMQNSFWIGVYPGMNKEMLSYMSEEIFEFVTENKARSLK